MPKDGAKAKPTVAIVGQVPAAVSPPSRALGGAEAAESAALLLLQFEAQVRQMAALAELAILVANGARSLIHARHAFVFEMAPQARPVAIAVSELATIDRSAPLVAWIERVTARHAETANISAAAEFTLGSYSADGDEIARTYPMGHALWVPLLRRDKSTIGGILFTREIPWREREITIGKRLGATIAHAWLALVDTRRQWSWRGLGSRRWRLAAAVGLLVALFPVSLTALAPLEIAARDSYVVAAPIDGVIEELAVAPNAAVREGQLLLRFSDTVLRNKFIIAEREVSIADARLKKIMQQSFSDIRGRHEVGLAQTELKLKRAERDFARDILTRAELKAGRTGVALLGDPRDLIGKPVATGERIMEIADPRRVEIRIDVGVSDSALLETGARVKAFLDSDPLRPREGRIVRADYQARVRDGNALTVRAVAEFDAPAADPPRLGLRGTAQVYGTTVPLIYYLLKRPLAALRQWVGV